MKTKNIINLIIATLLWVSLILVIISALNFAWNTNLEQVKMNNNQILSLIMLLFAIELRNMISNILDKIKK